MPSVGTHARGIALLTGVVCGAALCAGLAGPARPAGAAAATTTAVAKRPAAPQRHIGTYRYGSGARQNLTAYWYTGVPRGRPVLVMVHGGYWTGGSKAGWDGQARWWSAHGFAVVTMNYHYATQARWATQRSDVLKVLSWVHGHAKGLRANASKIVLMGSSAGGQMAVSVGAYGCGGCRVRGVVALSPVANPYSSWKIGHRQSGTKRKKLANAAVTLAGCKPRKSHRTCWNRWVDMAARYHAGSGDAPMLMYHSKKDLVPASESAGLASSLHAEGVRATVRVVPGHKHGGGILGLPGIRTEIRTWINGRV